MTDENQQIDPALLGGNPSGLDPNKAVGGMTLKEKPRGIKKLNKKGIIVAASLLGGAAIVATTTFNGTGSAIGTATKEAVANQKSPSRPTEMKRDTLWYASVPDKVAAGEPPSGPGMAQPDYLGIGNTAANAPKTTGQAPAAGGAGTAVPDLSGKAISPLAAATAARTGAAPYQAGAAAPATPADQAAANAQAQADQAAAQTRQMKQQLLDSAMKADLAAKGFGGEKQAQAAQAQQPSPAMGGMPPINFPAMPAAAQQREDDPNKQERKEQFMKAQAQAVDPEYSPSRKTSPRSPYELKASTVIPAVLISGINSDLPGEVIAQVREDVRDFNTGAHVLIPQGSRLVGLYDSHVAYGQRRILLAWNRVIFRDGSSFDLKGMPGADMSGYAGFADQVDNHYAKIFGSSVLMSLISAGVQLSQPSSGGNTNNQPSVSQTVGAALGQQIGQTAMNITQKNLNIQPTLEIRPGYRFNIMVTADMILPPVAK